MPTKDSKLIGVRVRNSDYRTFKATVEHLGMTPNGMINKMIRVVNNGFKPAPFDYKEFLKACDRCGISYQKAINIATQAVDEAWKIKKERLKKYTSQTLVLESEKKKKKKKKKPRR